MPHTLLPPDDLSYLRADVAIPSGIQRLATPVGREHTGLPEHGRGDCVQHHVDTAQQRRLCAAPSSSTEPFQSGVGRHERARAGRVHCHSRPFQPMMEGHAAGAHAEHGALRCVR